MQESLAGTLGVRCDINDGASLPLVRKTCISESLMKRFDFPIHYPELVNLGMDLIMLF